jgi:hypothetical protein
MTDTLCVGLGFLWGLLACWLSTCCAHVFHSFSGLFRHELIQCVKGFTRPALHMDIGRKILIHIRNSKQVSETPVHKKVRAHLHAHAHDHARKVAQHRKKVHVHVHVQEHVHALY